MEFRVSDIIKIEKLNNLKIVSGVAGIDNLVEYLDVLEMPESMEGWYRENLLIITSFNTIRENKDKQIKIIYEFFKFGGAGIILAPEFYNKHSINHIKEVSDKLGIPILLLPEYIGYAELIKLILEEIFKNKNIDLEKKKVENFFRRIINNDYYKGDDILNDAINYKINIKDYKLVIVLKIKKLTNESNNMSNLNNSIIDYIQEHWRLIAFSNNEYIAIIPSCYEEVYSKDYYLLAKSISDKILDKFENIYSYFGIGSKYEEIIELHKSYTEAKMDIEISEKIDDIILRVENKDILDIILRIKDNDYLEKFYSKTIKPLEVYDKMNKTNLLETLVCYFNNNEKMKDTSEELYIHINTVKYRLNKIKEILCIDDLTIDIKVNLYIGLKIRTIIK